MSNSKKIAIIGAGPAGLSAGYELAKKAYLVDVYEADDTVGGMCKSLNLWGTTVDTGPHRFFSKNRRVNELWLEVVKDEYKFVNRLTRINYRNKFYNYPLKPFNALSNLGILETALCVLSYLKEKLSPTPDKGTFETWVISRFGKRLYHHFFKTYSEKLWGIKCHELDADFAKQRIKKFSLTEAMKSVFIKTDHATLVEKFAYPLKGTGYVYSKMADRIKELGGNVYTSRPIRKVLVEGNAVCGIELPDGQQVKYDHVISTMPLTTLVENLPNLPSQVEENVKKLKFRNTLIVYLNVPHHELFPDQWLYIHAPDVLVGRITNFRNWIPELYGDQNKYSVLALEYWFHDNDVLWKSDDTSYIINKAIEEIEALGLTGNCEITQGHVLRIPKCYPIYEPGYKDYLSPIESYLNSLENLTVIGRGGAFKYNNQDHSIYMGILAAENIADNKNHNLWEVNTDDEYQEDETGLAKQNNNI
ncbi:hypothetical protein A3K34_02370 [candidate division WWE3 bacterium RIFOXYC1_FULL_40_10]|uniref:Amine oxidase domain-containing protein n=1 Tax=candidate division WWE3 bacterium RIFOXYA2_FULL_46_9 TaxID=1802636 RepID=A0A1F4VZ75_UNCKA|nr:MAG: hypothetical protein A3K58_02370 [candidate division WWE3 bacterium RIFOXYB1_FULL_40_22]OGC61697.1 MAG: hypothetical protein A3K37_02370 [candidate division WWE3 bacterium RIFOXYA1_FULL_40_11]OGC62318.1 MAG: hypothetical protein A2264_02000 [candidate division WWE3 bacterium RIFOXYA2_FULL_46_9]OGC64872.1 MAG: hypothetical protein A2326_01195 [candidate division WWE3 bacterium RIFOXYB2_FULL_41_6]OGC66080.1 MAG: hypothetical protein A3K34_02370 [candidate division WWE3 bacterium RIFOXYC1_